MNLNLFYRCTVVTFVFVSLAYSQDCKDAIGIERGEVPDNKISASSSYDNLSEGARGRLNIKYQPPKKSGWCARESNQKQYLEFDLEADSELTGIATQGRGRQPYQHWVSKYYVSYRSETSPWINLTRPNQDKPEIFMANSDAFSTVFRSFDQTIKARYIQIHPVEWNVQICMRAELYGCLGEKLVIKDENLLIIFIVLLAIVFCFVLLLLILLLTMRRVLKILERRMNEKARTGIELRDSIDGNRFKMERSSYNTYIPEESNQGTFTQTKKKDMANKNIGESDTLHYATIQTSSGKTEEKGKKYKSSSDPKTILVHADEEDEKRKYDENNSKKEKLEMVDL